MPKLPLRLEFTIYTGTTFRRDLRWKPDGTTPQDFTGWSAAMRIGMVGDRAVIELTTSNQGVLLGPDGMITLRMPPAATDALRAGTYGYVLDLTDPDGDVLRFLRGRCEIIRDYITA